MKNNFINIINLNVIRLKIKLNKNYKWLFFIFKKIDEIKIKCYENRFFNFFLK